MTQVVNEQWCLPATLTGRGSGRAPESQAAVEALEEEK